MGGWRTTPYCASKVFLDYYYTIQWHNIKTSKYSKYKMNTLGTKDKLIIKPHILERRGNLKLAVKLEGGVCSEFYGS